MASPSAGGLTLVTGAAPGSVGSVAYKVVRLLRTLGIPVRALVHHSDERVRLLRDLGADVVVGDLCDATARLPARRASSSQWPSTNRTWRRRR